MAKLSEIFESVRAEPDFGRVQLLAANDYELLAELVEIRKKSGLRQQDVGNVLGMSQQAVSQIESYDSDPKLSTLRRYANAIGAIVRHVVTPDMGVASSMTTGNVVSYETTSHGTSMRLRPSDSRLHRGLKRTGGAPTIMSVPKKSAV